MAYRDPQAPTEKAPAPRRDPWWTSDHVMAALAIVVLLFSPLVLPWMHLRDARVYLALARWQAPLGARGVTELLARLEREAPSRVEHIEAEWGTGMAAEEPRWSAVLVRFADRSSHVVSALPSYADPNAVAVVIRAARAHDVTVRERAINEHPWGLSDIFMHVAVAVWAVALALLVGPWASLIVVAPSPASRLVRARCRRAAHPVLPATVR